MSSYENPFFILGLHPQVVKDIANSKLADLVDAQYKAMSKIYHPDRGGDPEKYRLIREAFDDLQSPSSLKAFADQYRASKRDYLEMMNDRLLASKETNTSILKSLSDFIIAIGSERALPNLEQGWVFAGLIAGGILTLEVGENHLITAARRYEWTERINCEYDGDPVPTGYYFAINGFLVGGVQRGKVIERKECKPPFRALEIQDGSWYYLEHPKVDQLDKSVGTQYIAELTKTGKTTQLSLRPAFMVRRAETGEENKEAVLNISNQLLAKPNKAQARKGMVREETLKLNLERVYSQLEPLPTMGADLFVRDKEGEIFPIEQVGGLSGTTLGFGCIIPPPQENEGGGK